MTFSLFDRLRAYHAALGCLAALAYVTEDWTSVHVWIGYAVAGILALRLLAVAIPRVLPRPAWFIGAQDVRPDLGLKNPLISKAFIAGIMGALVITIATGVMLDQSKTTSTASLDLIATAQADERGHDDRKRSKGDKALKGLHEVAANGAFALVGLHVAYLLLMRRRYALRMLFIEEKR